MKKFVGALLMTLFILPMMAQKDVEKKYVDLVEKRISNSKNQKHWRVGHEIQSNYTQSHSKNI